MKKNDSVENWFRNMEDEWEKFSQNFEEKGRDVGTVKERMTRVQGEEWGGDIQLGEDRSAGQAGHPTTGFLG